MSDQQSSSQTGGEKLPAGWQREEVGGLNVELRLPRDGSPAGPVLIYLHDDDCPPVTGDSVLADVLDHFGATVVCPGSTSCWWTNQVTPDFPGPESAVEISPVEFLRSQLIPWVAERTGTSPPLVGLMGLGSGGQGVLQLAYRRAREFPAVVAITPAVDFHRLHGAGTVLDRLFSSPEAARQQTATLWLHPLNWPRHQLLLCDRESPWFEGAERLAMKLSSSGIMFESDFDQSARGDLTAAFHQSLPTAVSFLAERLELESRRLP